MSSVKEKQGSLPSNICRTMPYTIYIGVFSHAVIFNNKNSFKFFMGLIANEGLNHALKFLVKRTLGENDTTKRPPGAIDTGIFPTHYPEESKTMGMPSGHAQTITFAATILMKHLFNRTFDDSGTNEILGHLPGVDSKSISISYILLVTLGVLVSRTKYGGILSVSVKGEEPKGCHTVLQVVIGGIIGTLIGSSVHLPLS